MTYLDVNAIRKLNILLFAKSGIHLLSCVVDESVVTVSWMNLLSIKTQGM